MVLDKWDKVIQTYEDIYLESKYSYHAKAMIELVPEIRSLPEFNDIQPGTSHGALLFSVPDKSVYIIVLYSENDYYDVHLQHPSNGEISKQTATSENILSVLKTFVEQLKSA